MGEAQSVTVVQNAYAAFGRGDIATLLSYMSDDFTWQPVIGTAKHVPFSGERKGKAAVGEFFKEVAESEDFSSSSRESSSHRGTRSWRSAATAAQ